jgi:predicted lipid-binding transport protein (Tim44 family)
MCCWKCSADKLKLDARRRSCHLVLDFARRDAGLKWKKGEVGGIMLAMLVGMLLALAFFGLPLAIIGLFIMSILDRSNKRTVRDYRESSASVRHILSPAPDWSGTRSTASAKHIRAV